MNDHKRHCLQSQKKNNLGTNKDKGYRIERFIYMQKKMWPVSFQINGKLIEMSINGIGTLANFSRKKINISNTLHMDLRYRYKK